MKVRSSFVLCPISAPISLINWFWAVGCSGWRSRSRCWQRSVRHTKADSGVGCPARATRITASQRQLRDRESQVPEIVKIVNRGHSFVARERMPELSKTTVSLAEISSLACTARIVPNHSAFRKRNRFRASTRDSSARSVAMIEGV